MQQTRARAASRASMSQVGGPLGVAGGGTATPSPPLVVPSAPISATAAAVGSGLSKMMAGVNLLPTVNPTSLGGGNGRDAKRSGSRRLPTRLLQYMKRLVRFSQMDFEVALWQMVHVLFSQQRAYRDLYLHKQTKNQWARDDPAFVVIMVGILTVCAVFYGIAFGRTFPAILKLVVTMVLVDFVLVGIVISTLAWFFCNRFLRVQTVHSVEQRVEWAYAFDVHCNGFVPILLLLYVLQFFFMPILTKSSIVATLLGNTLYFVALAYYQYIMFLGYSALPFLQYTEVFLLPCGIYAVLYVVSLFFVNISAVVLRAYLGPF